jgi:hypothetical protein
MNAQIAKNTFTVELEAQAERLAPLFGHETDCSGVSVERRSLETDQRRSAETPLRKYEVSGLMVD